MAPSYPQDPATADGIRAGNGAPAGDFPTHWPKRVYDKWLSTLRHGGAAEFRPDFATCKDGWASPSGTAFQVRGSHYFENKDKIEAGEWLLQPLAFDWAKSSAGTTGSKLCSVMSGAGGSRVRESMEEADRQSLLSTLSGGADEEKVRRPFVWAFNIQIPSKEHHSLIMYYVCDPRLAGKKTAAAEIDGGVKNPAHVDMIRRFVALGHDGLDRDRDHDLDLYRNSRFKLVASVAQGPWIVKRAVGERAGACLLGRAVTCTYLSGPDFMEVDVDVSSSMIAHAIVQLAFGYVSSLTVDIGFLIESQAPHELPERLLGAIRFANLNPALASVILPRQLQPPPPPTRAASLGRPSSCNRLWRSFSNLIHHNSPDSDNATASPRPL